MAILNDILNRVLGGNASAGSLADDFHAVTQNAPTDVISKGLQAALNSNETPAAGQMIGQMFEQSSPEQRAAMLNQLIAALGPSAQGVLGGILGSILGTGVPRNRRLSTSQKVAREVTRTVRVSPRSLPLERGRISMVAGSNAGSKPIATSAMAGAKSSCARPMTLIGKSQG